MKINFNLSTFSHYIALIYLMVSCYFFYGYNDYSDKSNFYYKASIYFLLLCIVHIGFAQYHKPQPYFTFTYTTNKVTENGKNKKLKK